MAVARIGQGPTEQDTRPHVVVIGGGFSGIQLVRTLRKAPVRITLIDRQNHHLFQPLLYQVATAGLGAPDISQPIREIVRGQENCTVILGEVQAIDLDRQTVSFDAETLSWDWLYVATGATHSYFGNDHWAPHAPGLKNLADAMDIRRRVIMAYERAERAELESERKRELTFVVVGAGPTGVELAGALAEIAHRTMSRNFRNFEPASATVMLVEAGGRALAAYHEKLSQSAVKQLDELGVRVLLNTRVTDVNEEGVMLNDRFVPAATILWAAGVKSSPLGALLGVPLDRAGRVIVNPDLTVPGYEHVSVLGDLAAVATKEEGKYVPGLAPAAMQMGRYAGKRLQHLLKGKPIEAFEYFDKGQMATIGKRRAVAQTGNLRFSGYFAWLAWALIHVAFLIGFRNRVAVMLDWIWSYFTQRRGARILWGVDPAEAAPRNVRPSTRHLDFSPLPEETTTPTGPRWPDIDARPSTPAERAAMLTPMVQTAIEAPAAGLVASRELEEETREHPTVDGDEEFGVEQTVVRTTTKGA